MKLPLVHLLLASSIALSVAANEVSTRAHQSGDPEGPRIFADAGIYGVGQVIAILDTGLDWDGCYFSGLEDGVPPINTVTSTGELESANVDPTRRKVIAYDFLYSCDEYPGQFGCEEPGDPFAWDNQGHGTHAAASAAGDRLTPLLHDFGDAMATGAKLVIQDAGYIGGDNCSQRPGLRCPLRDLRDVLRQARDQGARIHSNSWGNRQGVPATAIPPTGNYTPGASEIDDFVHRHRDMVVVFNTGNAGSLGPSSISSPGSAKNTIQVGGFEWKFGLAVLTGYSGYGPTRDGRIKPEVVGPSLTLAGDTDFDVRTFNCDHSYQGGTSWASPTIAGVVALIREYFERGFYPTGAPDPGSVRTPSAALVRAILVASARAVSHQDGSPVPVPAEPVPSYRQGWGYPVLADALPLGDGPRSLYVLDEEDLELAEGGSHRVRIRVAGGGRARAVLAWTDPPGASSEDATTPKLVNDLDLLAAVDGGVLHGNESLHPGHPDRLNNIEVVTLTPEVDTTVLITVSAERIAVGGSQSAALVLVGDFEIAPEPRRRGVRRR